MNTSQLSNTKQLIEPEELEFWELMDFDDVVHSIDEPTVENDFIYNKSLN